MAGIGFELRKLFNEQGLISQVRAYGYASMTSVGPMILSLIMIIALQIMMTYFGGSFIESELFITTVTYVFVFSIIMTSGLSMVLSRFIADMIFQKKYEHLLSSFYGAIIICLPFSALVSVLFLHGVSASMGYKIATYLFFLELIIIWIQSIYLSALKDYERIVRSFAFGIILALLSGWLLFTFTDIQPTVIAILAIDIGFLAIVIMTLLHFEQTFVKAQSIYYFAFIENVKKYPSLFFTGLFVYSGVYIHSFIYWFGPYGFKVANRYLVMPFYDLPVFYAYMSVVPSLVIFVIVVETGFYEKFRSYYLNVVEGGTFPKISRAKTEMQKSLLLGVSFLIEVQLLFTILGIAIGIIMLPKIGFTMIQLDVFIILSLGFFFFIIMFVLVHLLLYFDDRKGAILISSIYIITNATLTYWMMLIGFDGFGMFIASFISLILAILRILYILRNIDYYTFSSQPLTTRKSKKKTKKWTAKPKTILIFISLFSLVLSACTDENLDPSNEQLISEKEQVEEFVEKGISEDKRIYERDDDTSVKTLYMTVFPDKSGTEDPIGWYELNRMTDRYSEENLDIILAEGDSDGKGPKQGMFGYGDVKSNAKVSLRGNTARYAAQKSYKIKLFDETGLWQNQRIINLNKHSTDLSRLRNKLSFDLFEKIPHITSLRTQFVRLYVKDLSSGNEQTSFEDYGLYTQIEQPNEMFLKSHWLDPYGQLYKVNFFEFQRYPELLRSQSDPLYNKDEFETILEIKGREDHDKLLKMLDDLNNVQIPIEDVVEKHFDLDNILTWTAINILTDNMDTDANNFYLYSPLNSLKWYILPWDYDGGWELQREGNDIRSYQAGISNFWGSTLHNRYFRNQDHIQLLIDKINEVSNYINKDRVKNQLDIYQEIVKPFLSRPPDNNYLPGLSKDFEKELKQIYETPDRGKARFFEDLEKPKPFYLDDVISDGKNLTFSWGISFDLQGNDLLYDFTISKDPAFTQIIASNKDLQKNKISIPKPSNGIYYWKVIVRDSEGHEQIAFDAFTDVDGNDFFGIREFEVK